uniref:Uncharacterized protein n=1 Tax=Romanomermis culicivorax TaxID=13658 RepID=A0A915HEQ4_ROMCU
MHGIRLQWLNPGGSSNDYESTKEFILKQFLRNKPPSKVIFHHFTNATDTQNIEVVFGASVSTILARNMSTVGIS